MHRVGHRRLFVAGVCSDGLMRLVHIAYKARKLSIHCTMMPSDHDHQQLSHYVSCTQLCNKASELLRDLVSCTDNRFPANTLTKVSFLSLLCSPCLTFEILRLWYSLLYIFASEIIFWASTFFSINLFVFANFFVTWRQLFSNLFQSTTIRMFVPFVPFVQLRLLFTDQFWCCSVSVCLAT